MGRALPVDHETRLAHCVAAYSRRCNEYATRTADLMADEVAAFARRLSRGATVLDAGCGPGRDLARFVAAGLSPVGVDLTPEFVAMAARVPDGHGGTVPVLWGDLRSLPMRTSSFDAVWACASLVHLEQGQASLALAELRRVARRGAPGYVCVKTGESGWRSRPGATRRWFQGWSHGELGRALEVTGWAIAQLSVGEEWVEAWTVAR